MNLKFEQLRTVFLVFYEDLPSLRTRTFVGIKQRSQKRGLRETLSTYGPVEEIDYRRLYKRMGKRGFIELLKRKIASFQPNLILSEIHGTEIFTESDIINLRKEMPATRWVNWNGDYEDFNKITEEDTKVASAFDLHLVVAYDNVAEYTKRGIKADYWQIGWEPDGINHEPGLMMPRHDIVFLSNNIPWYPSRIKMIENIRNRGINLGLYGKRWPKFWAKGSCLYDFKKGCRLIRAAKLVLADNPRPNARGYVSNRLFQSLVAGRALLLMQYFKDYETLGFIDGEHLVVWQNINDLIEKIGYWLKPKNSEQRSRIAKAGKNFCLENHSSDVRVRELMEMLAQL